MTQEIVYDSRCLYELNATSDFEHHPSLEFRSRLLTGPSWGTSIANQEKFQPFSERKNTFQTVTGHQRISYGFKQPSMYRGWP